MRFLSTDIYGDADTMEKVLMQLLDAFHFIANSITFKLRNPLSSNDDGIEPVISRTEFIASDGTTRVTFVIHFEVASGINSTAYTGPYQAAQEMTTAAPASTYIGT